MTASTETAADPVPDRYGRRDVAVVTGAARGLGAAVARRLVLRGMRVLVVDHCVGHESDSGYAHATNADLDRTLGQLGPGNRSAVLDARDTEKLGKAIGDFLYPDDRVVAVVAAAATIEGGDDQWTTEVAQLDRLWESNVKTVWSTAAATVPHLLHAAESGAGATLVAIASLAAHQGLYHLTAYCTVKHAVVGLVRGLAADLTNRGVTVCAVSPDAMATAMLEATAALYGIADVADLCRDMECQAPLDPDDVAAMVEWALVSGPAVHGMSIRASGGLGVSL
ncbi:MAG: mycofactocin-coupled SDR family oxidoreductase [Dermatophilaceae bacterium]